MFTNFSPIRHVNDVKGTYFVKKINIYLIKNSFVFTSRGPRIFGFISSAAHFSGHFRAQGSLSQCWVSLASIDPLRFYEFFLALVELNGSKSTKRQKLVKALCYIKCDRLK